MGGDIESGENKEFLNKNVFIRMDYFINNEDHTRNIFDLVIELTAFDSYNNPECEFATFCRFYPEHRNPMDKSLKYQLRIVRQKFKVQGEWYAIHDAFGLGGSDDK